MYFDLSISPTIIARLLVLELGAERFVNDPWRTVTAMRVLMDHGLWPKDTLGDSPAHREAVLAAVRIITGEDCPA